MSTKVISVADVAISDLEFGYCLNFDGCYLRFIYFSRGLYE